MTLSNLNNAWNNNIIRVGIQQQLGGDQNGINIPFPVISSYEDARNFLIKSEEHAPMWRDYLVNGETSIGIHNDGIDLPTIGYGFNLNAHSYTTIEAALTHVYGTLSAEQSQGLAVLQEWKEGPGIALTSSTGQPVTIQLSNLDIIEGAEGNFDNLAANYPNLSLEGLQTLQDYLTPLSSLTLTEAQANNLLTAYIDGLADRNRFGCKIEFHSPPLGPGLY